jgi:phosphoribosylformylglycinamidine cyclo-ligase
MYATNDGSSMKEDPYSAAGVHIDVANDAVKRYQSLLAEHSDPRVLRGIGGFSGCFSFGGYRDPVLVASTDGVGTKVIVAAQTARYDGIGADLVHHCINDVLCSNARPLFFLDYLAMGTLDSEVAAAIVGSVARACTQHHVALLGGETAEMPGVYTPPQFDLAGTIIGALERADMLDIASVGVGDIIVGLPGNGLHTNGYSLARKVLDVKRWSDPLSPGSNTTIADALLAVHPCYLEIVEDVKQSGVAIKSMAHITGGGLTDNLARALSDHVAARIDASRWNRPPIIDRIVRDAHLSSEEAFRVLNMGIGFCLVVANQDGERALMAARDSQKQYPIPGAVNQATIIGEVEPGHPCGPRIIIDGA